MFRILWVVSSVQLYLMLGTHPKVKPAAAAASCRSPDEVAIEARKERGVKQIATVSEDQRGAKEREQYECEIKPS